jgi:hypothetical protein
MPECHRAILGCNTAICPLLSPEIAEVYVRLLLSRSLPASVPLAGGAVLIKAKRFVRAATVWVIGYPLIWNEYGGPGMLLVYGEVMRVPLACRGQNFLLAEGTTWPFATTAHDDLPQQVDPGSHVSCSFECHSTRDWTNMRLLGFPCRHARIMRSVSPAADMAGRFGISSAYN